MLSGRVVDEHDKPVVGFGVEGWPRVGDYFIAALDETTLDPLPPAAFRWLTAASATRVNIKQGFAPRPFGLTIAR